MSKGTSSPKWVNRDEHNIGGINLRENTEPQNQK